MMLLYIMIGVYIIFIFNYLLGYALDQLGRKEEAI